MDRHANVTDAHPRCGFFAHWVGRTVRAITRWKIVGVIPESPKGVFIAAPHTTWWDLVHMLSVAWSLRIRLSWVGKAELFRFPLGWFMRALGGVPVYRESKTDTVGQLVQRFAEVDGMYLSIAPSGTRKKRDHWKSGFYHVCARAEIPILCGFLDYAKKEGGIGPVLLPSGDLSADMDRIREFYSGVTARYPELLSTVRLREEPPPPD